MTCTEIKTVKYQTRKSPAFHAKDCKDLTKKGKDGQYISKPDSNGTYKWVKVNTDTKVNTRTTRKMSGKYYDTHDNGGRPFRVYVDGKKVAIYMDSNIGTFNEKANYSKLVKEFTVKEVYIGKSTGNASGADHRPNEAKSFVGNSILLHVSGNTYVHIGTNIYQFQMDDKVEEYFSMVGRNDVPYPVLLGTENVYFMLKSDHSYIPRELLPANLTKAQWEDAYTYFYGWTNPETGESRTDQERKKDKLENKAKKMKGYKIIT